MATTTSNLKKLAESLDKLKLLVISMEEDETKFNAGTNSAGSRMRKTLQEIKVEASAQKNVIRDIKKASQDFRVEILEKQKLGKSK